MLLAIDIGNSNVVIGLYRDDELVDSFRAVSQRRQTVDEVGLFIVRLLDRVGLSADKISQIVLGSVVPPLTPIYETAATKYLDQQPLVVSAKIKLPIQIKIDKPDEIGADRIANASAAYDRFGGPVIVVDFGTATTFDIVDTEGAYIGGVIIPGPETSMAELARRASRLFEIRIERPDRVIGKSTAGALKSGLFYGTVGQVDYIIDAVIAEAGFENTTIIATGGLASGLEKASKHISAVVPELTLEGLRLIGAYHE